MTVESKKKRVRPRIYKREKCGSTHQFPKPLSGRRPVVVFCVQCQTGHSLS